MTLPSPQHMPGVPCMGQPVHVSTTQMAVFPVSYFVPHHSIDSSIILIQRTAVLYIENVSVTIMSHSNDNDDDFHDSVWLVSNAQQPGAVLGGEFGLGGTSIWLGGVWQSTNPRKGHCVQCAVL